jgi:predicted DNA-binding transcriptional regulator YafY
MNESIYYNVDAINDGMQKNCKISFTYWNWNEKKEMIARQGGKRYIISPWLLMWEDEKYYLVGYDDSTKGMKHFRVDKMQQIQVMQNPRNGQTVFRDMDVAAYSVENFGMFHGKKETVTLRVENELTGVMIDRFGKDVWLHPMNELYSAVVVDVMVSNQFFGWITGLGGKVRIEGPQWVKDEYQRLLQSLLE